MRDVLLDVVRQTSTLFEVAKVEGTAKETKVRACDSDKTLFLVATLKTPEPEFEGQFGLSNMTLLNGLLNFVNYRTDDAVLTVKDRQHNGKRAVERFEFRNKVTGNEADFRLMSPDLVPEQATISNIPWDVTVSPSKAKLSEFSQLAGLYAEVDKQFGVKTSKKDGDLIFYIGDASSATHSVSMIFEAGIKGELKSSQVRWNTSQFLAVMKLTGNHPTVMKVTDKGVLVIEVETQLGTYEYYLRANR